MILLTLAAGSADALGYLSLGKVFTSNMTGNVVLMGIALSEGRGNDTGRSLFALFAFIVGNCFGAWICSRVGPRTNATRDVTITIGCEAALLLAYAVCPFFVSPGHLASFGYALIALLGLSMGLQAAAVFRLGTPGVTTTAITGTLTNLFAGLMKIVNFLPSPRREDHVASFGLQSLVIVTYCGGAAMSGLLLLHARPWAFFFPAAMAAATFFIRLIRRG